MVRKKWRLPWRVSQKALCCFYLGVAVIYMLPAPYGYVPWSEGGKSFLRMGFLSSEAFLTAIYKPHTINRAHKLTDGKRRKSSQQLSPTVTTLASLRRGFRTA